ncbi:MAG TPA: alpha/beta fold hydrolase [Actinomycetota bacterium]|nr:alpha/beta fold hydrolase [Actinomycetota bacterium]
MRRLACVVALVALLFAALPASAQGHRAYDDVVTNHDDGTEIAVTVFRPAGSSAAAPAPVVLHSHGWGGSRETAVGAAVKPYLDAGFGVVSFDQRGHGDSSGQAYIQDPTRETEDVKAVIDFVAGLDWVRLEAPGDPVLGAIGGSYGGAYQTMTALDEIADEGATRFDALAPQITWFDLPESLAPQKVVRTAWVLALYGAGSSMLPQHVHEAFVWGSATGQWPDGTLYDQPAPAAPDIDSVLAENGPRAFVERGIRIDVPVLLRQGASDNLFDLNEGLKIFERALTDEARAQSYFVSFNGGHALPNALPPGEPADVQVGGGVDACTDFTATTIEFFERVFSGTTTGGLLPARYNFTAVDGKTCLRTGSVPARKQLTVAGPFGTGEIVTTAGGGAPQHLPLLDGPANVAGVPVLEGKVTSAALDGRAFFGLAIGTTPADARVVHNNLLPLRRAVPVTDSEFEIELPGVVAKVPAGKTLYLTVTPVSDMFFGHGSRTPGAMVLTDVSIGLPLTNCAKVKAKFHGTFDYCR